MPSKIGFKKLLFIPESRKRPLTESLLYKQIIRFLRQEKIDGAFATVFISIADGIREAHTCDAGEQDAAPNISLPPKRFASGQSWISKEVKQAMAERLIAYLTARASQSPSSSEVPVSGGPGLKTIAYVRGSYLDAVRMANEALSIRSAGLRIQEIFTEEELINLKKRGIMWMKVGLRMPEAFEIFQKRIVEFSQNKDAQQLQLF